MNQLKKLIVLLPCHALEDFPIHHTAEHAASLLANWTALWHPSLIEHSGSLPGWMSIDFVTDDLTDTLILAPTTCSSDIPVEVSDVVDAGEAILVAAETSRDFVFNHEDLNQWIDRELDQEFVQDFFALGYAHLQIQLMTRQLRYSSTLDLPEFEQRVIAAAESCCNRNSENEVTRKRLIACFDLLLEERNNYYPTEPKMLDLVLLASTTVGLPLRNQLTTDHATNFLISGEVLELIRDRSPDVWETLKKHVADNRIDFAGVQQFEQPTPLVSIESILNQIKLGLETSKCQLGSRPSTFGSFRFGMSPQLPSILNQFDFELAIHNSFSGGKMPHAASPVMNWQGIDGTNMPAISTPPIDAYCAEGFLKLGVTIGEMFDSHHHCSLIFAHWPDQVSCWYNDLIRIEKYGPLFGRFQTLSKFGETIYDNGFSETFTAEEYQFPWLESRCQSAATNPISAYVGYWKLHYRLAALTNMLTLIGAIRSSGIDIQSRLYRLREIQSLLDHEISMSCPDIAAVETQFNELLKLDSQIEERLPQDASHALTGTTIVNPLSVPRTLTIKSGPEDQGNCYHFDPFDITLLDNRNGIAADDDPSMVKTDKDSGNPILRNEFFEVQVDAETGGIRNVNRHQKRGNLLSQRLSARTSETIYQHGYPRQKHRYSQCRADENLLASTQAMAQVKSTGQLVDMAAADNSVADVIAQFEQTISLARGSRRIELDILIKPEKALQGPVWNNYACSRIALPLEDAPMFRSENEIREPVEKDKFTAPNFVEIQLPDAKLTLLPGGLPFHRKSNPRMLDTLLMVPGETETRFQFAIAIDTPISMQAATDYLSPFYSLSDRSLIADKDGWIFHLNCKNVVVTHMRPKFNESGAVCGVQIRIHETEGRAGELTITCPFKLTSASRTNFWGDSQIELQSNADNVICNFCEFQFFQVECCW